MHELDKENSIIKFKQEVNNEHYISIIQEFEKEIYFLVIIYNKNTKFEEIINEYPDLLAIVSKNLIELINTNKITRAISEAFNTIKNYSKLEKDENLLNIFKDKIKYTILQILRNGIISKTRLKEILKQEYGFSTINIDFLLLSLIRENLVVKKIVPGKNECYILVKDISCTRVPPKSLPDEAHIEPDIINKYKKDLMNFFADYDCASEIENETIINFLTNKEVYSLLIQLREKSLSLNECLNILNNREDLFKELLENKYIYDVKGKVLLFSDIRFIKFTPFYIIETLLNRYREQEITFDEYLIHLKLLTLTQTQQINNRSTLIDYEIT